MKRFIQGEHRGQGTLLPESHYDYVSDTNPVRVVDVFVDELDLVSRYLAVLDAADRQEPTATEPSTVRLEEKIAKLKTQMKELQAIEIQLNESLDKQVSLTLPDARSMMTRGTGNRHEWTHNAVALFDFQRIGQTHHSRFDFISGQGRIAQQPPLFLLIAGVQPAEAGQSHARAGSLVDGLFLRPAIGQ
ncbi:hypothetical protein AF70_00023980 [Pseudomonas sp. KD5]|nr:hypothetical protein [Pseudomonas sp. KD5]